VLLSRYFRGDKAKNKDGWGMWHVQEKRHSFAVLVGQAEGKNHLENLGIGGRIILNHISQKWVGRAWTKFIWPRITARDRLM